jgi:beta propeller repeat protein
MVFSLLVIGFLTVMGIGVSLIQRSKVKKEPSTQRRLPIGGRGILTLFVGLFVITALAVYAMDETAVEPTGDLTFPVSRSLADQYAPVIGEMEEGEMFFLWEDNRDGNWDIFLKYFDSEDEVNLSSNSNDQRHPRVWQGQVVWEDNRNGNWDIFRYDLASEVQTQVTSSPTNQINPSVYGQYIVWEDDRNGNKDIYLNDIESGTIRQVTTSVLDQEQPMVYGTHIVWVDWRNDLDGIQTGTTEDNPDIYAIDIEALEVQ